MKQTSVFSTILLLACLLAAGPGKLLAQNEGTTLSRFSLHAAFGNQVVGFPFQNQGIGFFPALSDVGASFRLNRNTRHAILLDAQAAGELHPTAGNTLLLGLGIGYRYTHRSGAFLKTSLELGMAMLRIPRETYRFDAAQQQFLSADRAFGASYSAISFSLGMDLSGRLNAPVEAYVLCKPVIISPYFDTQAFNILPLNVLAIGVNVHLQPSNS